MTEQINDTITNIDTPVQSKQRSSLSALSFLYSLLFRILITIAAAGWIYSLICTSYKLTYIPTPNSSTDYFMTLYGIEFYDLFDYLFLYGAVVIFLASLWFVRSNLYSFISCASLVVLAIISQVCILIRIHMVFTDIRINTYANIFILIALIFLLIIRFMGCRVINKSINK